MPRRMGSIVQGELRLPQRWRETPTPTLLLHDGARQVLECPRIACACWAVDPVGIRDILGCRDGRTRNSHIIRFHKHSAFPCSAAVFLSDIAYFRFQCTKLQVSAHFSHRSLPEYNVIDTVHCMQKKYRSLCSEAYVSTVLIIKLQYFLCNGLVATSNYRKVSLTNWFLRQYVCLSHTNLCSPKPPIRLY